MRERWSYLPRSGKIAVVAFSPIWLPALALGAFMAGIVASIGAVTYVILGDR